MKANIEHTRGRKMPQVKSITTEDQELGKALCERAGLDPGRVLEDWDVQSFDDVVMLTFQVVHTMPREEFAAMVDRFQGSRNPNNSHVR